MGTHSLACLGPVAGARSPRTDCRQWEGRNQSNRLFDNAPPDTRQISADGGRTDVDGAELIGRERHADVGIGKSASLIDCQRARNPTQIETDLTNEATGRKNVSETPLHLKVMALRKIR